MLGAVAHAGNREAGTLVLVMVIHLGNREIELVAQAHHQALQHLPLLLERLAAADVQFDGQQSHSCRHLTPIVPRRVYWHGRG